MKREEIVAELIGLVASSLDMKREDVRVDATWDEYEKIESFALVELLVAIQERFSIRFNPSELRGVGSVGDLATAIEEKLSAA